MHCSVTWLLQQKINLQAHSTYLVDGYYIKSGCAAVGEIGLEDWEGLGCECMADKRQKGTWRIWQDHEEQKRRTSKM